VLDEGKIKAQIIKALFEEDVFCPTDSSLSAVHLSVVAEMAKDIEEINCGHNKDLSYGTSHRCLSHLAMIGIS
jgi:hypothetical protein